MLDPVHLNFFVVTILCCSMFNFLSLLTLFPSLGNALRTVMLHTRFLIEHGRTISYFEIVTLPNWNFSTCCIRKTFNWVMLLRGIGN
jgi:hypothetical protein